MESKLKAGDRVITNVSLDTLLVTGGLIRSGITGLLIDVWYDNEFDLELGLVQYTDGQKNLPTSFKYGELMGEFPLSMLLKDDIDVTQSVQDYESELKVGTIVRLKNLNKSTGRKIWAGLNKIKNGDLATIKGFYTCKYCNKRHILLEKDNVEIEGATFDLIEVVEENIESEDIK